MAPNGGGPSGDTAQTLTSIVKRVAAGVKASFMSGGGVAPYSFIRGACRCRRGIRQGRWCQPRGRPEGEGGKEGKEGSETERERETEIETDTETDIETET